MIAHSTQRQAGRRNRIYVAYLKNHTELKMGPTEEQKWERQVGCRCEQGVAGVLLVKDLLLVLLVLLR